MAGNVVKAIDARGYETEFYFDDRFGAPDAEAHLHTAPSELSSPGQASFAFATLVTNAAGHTFYTQRDYHSGQVVDAEDANGVVSSGYYADALDRPTKIISAASDPRVHTQTLFSYDDTNRTITTASDLDAFDDRRQSRARRYTTVWAGLSRRASMKRPQTYIPSKQTMMLWAEPSQNSNPFRAVAK